MQRATPRLPEEVRRLGVTTEGDQKPPDGSPSTFTDDSMSMLDLGNFARIRIQDELASIPGVGSAPVFGAGEYAMRVWMDPVRMTAHDLTPAICRGNPHSEYSVAAGTLGQRLVQPSPISSHAQRPGPLRARRVSNIVVKNRDRNAHPPKGCSSSRNITIACAACSIIKQPQRFRLSTQITMRWLACG